MSHVLWCEGIIGAGKTTATKILADKLGLRSYLEPVETNPYLKRFYDDPKRWASNHQRVHQLRTGVNKVLAVVEYE